MRGTDVTGFLGAALVLAGSATAAADGTEVADREVVEAVRMRIQGRFERVVRPELEVVTGAGWEGTALPERRDEEVAFGFGGLRWDAPGLVDLEGGIRLDGTWSGAPAAGGARALVSPRARADVALGEDAGLHAGRAAVLREGRTLADTTELGVDLRAHDGVAGSLTFFRTRVTEESDARLGVTVALAVTPAPWLALGVDASQLATASFGALEATFRLPSGAHGGARLLALPGRRFGSVTGVLDLEAGFRRGPVAMAMRLDNVLGAREMGGLDFASAWDLPEFGGKLPGVPDATGLPRTLRVGLTLWL